MLKFVKYQGLGNDFLVVDLRGLSPSIHPEQEDAWGFSIARALCDRRLGVGGDGVLTLTKAMTSEAAAMMRVLNSDGSEAEMCGNGLRCVVKFLLESEGKQATEITVDTGAGPLACTGFWQDGQVADVEVNMGTPRLQRRDIPMSGAPNKECLEVDYSVGERKLSLTAVSMGNPHAIAFVPEAGAKLRTLAEAIGPTLETHIDFPQRTNVELAKIHSSSEIELVVWERGVGITQACGTGACATVVAACRAGHCKPGTEVEVRLLGGSLFIVVSPDYQSVLMRGPATHVYAGTIDLSTLTTSA
ncbi:MAG: diaminopimelate epimerase [Kofleriaceae bacterium]|nr:diaminopimelate epimerase [Kofleriaceae bacterium]